MSEAVAVAAKPRKKRKKNKALKCSLCAKKVLSGKGGKFVHEGWSYKKTFVCNECYSKHNRYAVYAPCDGCGTMTNNAILINKKNGKYCRSCTTGTHIIDRKRFSSLKNFHTAEAQVPIKNVRVSRDLFFGIELEVEMENTDLNIGPFAESVAEAVKGKAIIKRDGSLRNGFEICSTGMTFDKHLSDGCWDALFRVVNKSLKKKEIAYKPSRAGMHIHFSKSAVTPEIGNKIYNFFRTCSPFVETVAERKANRFCVYPYPIPATVSMAYLCQHYSAINFCHDGTYEIRIFQTVMDKASFFKNLEFVKAMIDVASSGELNVETLTAYVKKNRVKFKNLYGFLKKNGLFKHEKKKIDVKKTVDRSAFIDAVMLMIEEEMIF